MDQVRNHGLPHEIQHFVETLRGSGWTSESSDSGTRVLEKVLVLKLTVSSIQ